MIKMRAIILCALHLFLLSTHIAAAAEFQAGDQKGEEQNVVSPCVQVERIFLFIGQTGTGKSCLIEELTGVEGLSGNAGGSCTTKVGFYVKEGICAIDTPAFNQTGFEKFNMSDKYRKVFQEIFVALQGIQNCLPVIVVDQNSRIFVPDLYYLEILAPYLGCGFCDYVLIVNKLWHSRGRPDSTDQMVESNVCEVTKRMGHAPIKVIKIFLNEPMTLADFPERAVPLSCTVPFNDFVEQIVTAQGQHEFVCHTIRTRLSAEIQPEESVQRLPVAIENFDFPLIKDDQNIVGQGMGIGFYVMLIAAMYPENEDAALRRDQALVQRSDLALNVVVQNLSTISESDKIFLLQLGSEFFVDWYTRLQRAKQLLHEEF